jgi:hypothetical protein
LLDGITTACRYIELPGIAGVLSDPSMRKGDTKIAREVARRRLARSPEPRLDVVPRETRLALVFFEIMTDCDDFVRVAFGSDIQQKFSQRERRAPRVRNLAEDIFAIR